MGWGYDLEGVPSIHALLSVPSTVPWNDFTFCLLAPLQGLLWSCIHNAHIDEALPQHSNSLLVELHPQFDYMHQNAKYRNAMSYIIVNLVLLTNEGPEAIQVENHWPKGNKICRGLFIKPMFSPFSSDCLLWLLSNVLQKSDRFAKFTSACQSTRFELHLMYICLL